MMYIAISTYLHGLHLCNYTHILIHTYISIYIHTYISNYIYISIQVISHFSHREIPFPGILREAKKTSIADLPDWAVP